MKKNILILFLLAFLFSPKAIAQDNLVSGSANSLNDPKKVAEMEGGVNSFFRKIGLGVNWKWSTTISEETVAKMSHDMKVTLNWFNSRGRALINFWLRIWSIMFRFKYTPIGTGLPIISLTPTPAIYNQCKDSDGDNRFKQGLVTSGKGNLCSGGACFDDCVRLWGYTRFVSYSNEWICVDDKPQQVMLECPNSCLGGHCIE